MFRTGKKKADSFVRITPLGGLGEIGKNMTVLETRNDVILVDCGFKFPEASMLGIDKVIPDIAYLKNKIKMIRGLLITHGHEDHKGGIPYLLSELGNPPIYSTKLTLGLISLNLKEHGLLDRASLKTIRPRQELRFGDFTVEPIRVNHSIPDSLGFAYHTPVGTIFHTGDFKFDFTPIAGQAADVGRLAELGAQGVKLLMSDSTNSETPGFTPSEMAMADEIDRIVSKAKGRMLVATFSSNLNRIQQFISASVENGRKVMIQGRSMRNNVNIAMELGYLKAPKGTLISPDKAKSLPDNKVTVLSTGSQGEAYSFLVRMADGTNRTLKVKKGDTILFSSTPIPGNEASVYRTVDKLFQLGAEVIYSKILSNVHVSGHAHQEEQKLMLNLLKPEYFMPVHGEYRHQLIHSRTAQTMGVKEENVFIMANGHTLELTKEGGTVDKSKNVRPVFVDGSGVGDIGNVVIKDRQVMSESGIFVVVVNINAKDGELLSPPEILSRGFIYVKESQDLIKEAKQLIISTLQKFQRNQTIIDPIEIRSELKGKLKDLLYDKTGRDPMVMPVVVALDPASKQAVTAGDDFL